MHVHRGITTGALAVAAALTAAVATAAPTATPARHRAPHRLTHRRPATRRRSPPAVAQTRYSLVNGCFVLRSRVTGQLVTRTADGGYAATAATPGAADALRLQASGLGRYLLYGQAGDFITPTGGAPSTTTEPTADWRVDRGGPGAFTLTDSDRNRTLAAQPDGRLVTTDAPGAGDQFTFEPATGCANFPEADLDASGTPAVAAGPQAAVSGFLDAHMHWAAFEFIGGRFHCGRPFSPLGVTFALPDCADIQGPQGSAAPIQNFLDFGAPAHPHDTRGWPTFVDWPAHETLTYEQTYYRWVQRAYLGGLRLTVVPLVANRVLCELVAQKQNPCDEMDTVRLELRDMHELQDYIDAQSGGPGRGWMRIVTDPFQARQVINQGKLAVVLGMETSEPFGCRGSQANPGCTQAQLDSQIDELSRAGIRSYFLLNKFDNALAGVRFDSGPVGAVINAGNHDSSDSFWQAQTCQGPEHDNTISPALSDGNPLQALGIADLLPSAGVPAYPAPPHCNLRGLTPLGAHMIQRLIAKHLLLDIDHLSVRAGDSALSLLEAARYSGVVSAHSWIDPLTYPRIYALGGVVTPFAGASTSFVANWQRARTMASPRYLFGIGWGSDVNGLGAQGAPRADNAANPVRYPFRSLDGRVTLDRQRAGQRTFDINSDGVAQYGLYPDWVQDLRAIAGPQIVTDLSQGAEAYLQMWERAVGVPGPGCRAAGERVGAAGVGPLRLGADGPATLLAGGQPAVRGGRLLRWCGPGSGQLSAVFTPGDAVGLLATTIRGDRAGGLGPGRSLRHPPRGTRRVGPGLYRRGRIVFGLRRRRVSFVATAAPAVVARASTLRADLRLAGLR